MKKLLAIVVLGLLWGGNTYSFETFKPLSNLNLKMHNSIEELYSSINDQKNKECQISFFHNGTYSTEYLNSTISESDFIAIANIKNKEFNVYCNKLVHKIKDSKNKLVNHEYTLDFDVCGGKIYSYGLVFHLRYKTLELDLSSGGFGENPEILTSWVSYFNNIIQKKHKLETVEQDPYKDIDGKIYKSFYDSRVWQHNTLDKKGKTKYLVYLSSTVYRNDKLGPTTNRVGFSIRDNTIKRTKVCRH